MMRRITSFILCIAAVLTFAVSFSQSSFAEPSMIPDRSVSYDWYQRKLGIVRSLDSEAETVFDYTVPENGVALIAFFTGDGSNVPSGLFFDELTEASWANNADLNIYAVECSGISAAETRAFLREHDKNGVIENVFYSTEKTMLPFWYYSLIENNGDMSDVSTISGSYGAVYLLIITEENGVKYIRYDLSGQRSVKYLQNYLNEFIDTGIPSVPIIDLTAVGNLHFEFVTPVIDIVNRERVKAGVSPLTSSSELTKLAMVRAIETAVYWSHTRPDGTSCFTVTVNGKKYSGDLLAENIAAVHSSPDKVMDSWMNSPGHRANILRSDFNQLGVGCFETAGIFYWVQLFGYGEDSTPLTSSLYPNEIPLSRVIENAERSVSTYSDLVGFLAIGTEVGNMASSVKAGEKTDVNLPFIYAQSIHEGAILRAAFEPYISSADENGKPFVSVPGGQSDPDLGIKVVSDRSIYCPRPANGTISIYPYKGSLQAIALPLTATVGEEGLKGDVNGDGKINAKDVVTLMKVIVGAPVKTFNEAVADINSDGKYNAKDVTALMKLLVTQTP